MAWVGLERAEHDLDAPGGRTAVTTFHELERQSIRKSTIYRVSESRSKARALLCPTALGRVREVQKYTSEATLSAFDNDPVNGPEHRPAMIRGEYRRKLADNASHGTSRRLTRQMSLYEHRAPAIHAQQQRRLSAALLLGGRRRMRPPSRRSSRGRSRDRDPVCRCKATGGFYVPPRYTN